MLLFSIWNLAFKWSFFQKDFLKLWSFHNCFFQNFVYERSFIYSKITFFDRSIFTKSYKHCINKNVKSRGFNCRSNQYITEIISNFVLRKMFGPFFSKKTFKNVIIILWKSVMPVSIIWDLWKLLLLLLSLKSIQESLSEFLKKIGPLTKCFMFSTLTNSFIASSVGLKLRSHNKMNFS